MSTRHGSLNFLASEEIRCQDTATTLLERLGFLRHGASLDALRKSSDDYLSRRDRLPTMRPDLWSFDMAIRRLTWARLVWPVLLDESGHSLDPICLPLFLGSKPQTNTEDVKGVSSAG
jgi:hypothetical protein